MLQFVTGGPTLRSSLRVAGTLTKQTTSAAFSPRLLLLVVVVIIIFVMVMTFHDDADFDNDNNAYNTR